ncbi:hypothetical protein C8R44DRAFT_896191 [Mycena epipterygia]|nr:hypothetical protein C8R44DRAFT_896191 [Mycena epipterygia]
MCEYIPTDEYDEHSTSPTQSPEVPVSNVRDPNPIQNSRRASVLPYTGPPPSNARPQYSTPSVVGSTVMQPGYTHPSFQSRNQGSTDPRYWNAARASSSQSMQPPYPTPPFLPSNNPSTNSGENAFYHSNALLLAPPVLNQGYDGAHRYNPNRTRSSHTPLPQASAEYPFYDERQPFAYPPTREHQ